MSSKYRLPAASLEPQRLRQRLRQRLWNKYRLESVAVVPKVCQFFHSRGPSTDVSPKTHLKESRAGASVFVGEAQAAWACGWRWVARMGGCGRPERGRVSLVLAQLRPCSHQRHESRQPALSPPAPQASVDPGATPPPAAPAGAAGWRHLAAQGKPCPPREGDTRQTKTGLGKNCQMRGKHTARDHRT